MTLAEQQAATRAEEEEEEKATAEEKKEEEVRTVMIASRDDTQMQGGGAGSAQQEDGRGWKEKLNRWKLTDTKSNGVEVKPAAPFALQAFFSARNAASNTRIRSILKASAAQKFSQIIRSVKCTSRNRIRRKRSRNGSKNHNPY